MSKAAVSASALRIILPLPTSALRNTATRSGLAAQLRASRPSIFACMSAISTRLASGAARVSATVGNGAAAKALHVVGSTGLRTGTGQPFTTKGLRADDSANLVTVDIGIADAQAFNDLLHTIVDAGMQTESQAITARIDGIDDPVNIARLETGDVQYRTEYFTFHIGDAVYLDDRRRYVGTLLWCRQRLEQLARRVLGRGIGADVLLSLFVDNRGNIGGGIPGITDSQCLPSRRSRASSCTYNMRSAEQRCPAD